MVLFRAARRASLPIGAALLLVYAFAPGAGAASPIAPVSPIAPIDSLSSPIAPIAPIAIPAGSPTSTVVPSAGPRPPSTPRAPKAPAVQGPAGVEARISAVTSRVADLTARLGALGQSDSAPMTAESAQAVEDLLAAGRETLAGPVTPPAAAASVEGCPVDAPAGTLRDGAEAIGVAQLCADSVAGAATPEAAKAIQWAFSQLGAPYACGGVGRMDQYRFDCSSLVTRAYYEGAGLRTATDTWAPTTRDLLPWGGVKLASWADPVDPVDVKPGDLMVYRTCETKSCAFQHVTMELADGYMLHTNRCGDVAHVAKSWGTGPERSFAVARRVNPEAAR